MNRIEINFIPCEPQPPGGYEFGWRVAGSGSSYTIAGYFFSFPAVFYDNTNPFGTCYEGYIRSVCGDNVFGTPILWSSCSDSGESGYKIALLGVCNGIESNYIITGGTAGDIVTVRATFSGALQRNANTFTKACLAISSAYGVSDPQICSTCYTDTLLHSFSLAIDVVITMPSDMATLILDATVQNGSTSPTSVNLAIIDVNGEAMDISIAGCRGNEGIGGTC